MLFIPNKPPYKLIKDKDQSLQNVGHPEQWEVRNAEDELCAFGSLSGCNKAIERYKAEDK